MASCWRCRPRSQRAMDKQKGPRFWPFHREVSCFDVLTDGAVAKLTDCSYSASSFPVPEPGQAGPLIVMSVSLFHRCAALPDSMSHACETKREIRDGASLSSPALWRLWQATGQQVDRHAVPVSAGERYQRGGNKRRKSPTTLSPPGTPRRPAVAVAGAEQFGKHRLLDADHHVVSDVGEHDGEEDNPEDRLRLQCHKEWPGAEGQLISAPVIDAATAKPVREPGEAGVCQTADRQPPDRYSGTVHAAGRGSACQ